MKRQFKAVEEGIIILQAKIRFNQDILEYEKDELSEKQKNDYLVTIKADEATVETNKKYLRYLKPLY